MVSKEKVVKLLLDFGYKKKGEDLYSKVANGREFFFSFSVSSITHTVWVTSWSEGIDQTGHYHETFKYSVNLGTVITTTVR